MLHFIDFEVFKENWLCVIKNPISKTRTVIIDDPAALEKYYADHKGEIFIGYNIRSYDQYIFKAIMCGFDPKKVNDYIIVKKKQGWRFSSLFRDVPLIIYDVMTSMHGLKQLEGFMGNNIKETSVNFTIDRELTPAELEESVQYCEHDVDQTMAVFMERKEEFESHMGLIKAFSLPLIYIGKTKAQLSAIILDARQKERHDEFDIVFPDTLKIEKYKEVVEWYENPVNHDYEKSLEIEIAGVPHIFAWGGLHGAIEKYSGEGVFINVDVASYYPSLMIEYDFGSRNMDSIEKFKEIYHTRLKYKAEKNPLANPLKIVLNSTYGAMKDKYNQLYDPRQANNVCIGGQLLLLDLIEKLEPHCQIIQSNTDGVLVKLNSIDDYDLIDDVCYEWEKRTRMTLEFDQFKQVFQKDVNNYIIVDLDGKYKSKGAYVKKLTNLDYDLPIVNKAIIEYFLNKTSIADTINNCKALKDFQKIVKVSGKYMHALHGDKILNEKTLRVFASNDPKDQGVFKVKSEDKNPEKFALTPESCFVENGDVNEKRIPRKLNREWYIELANKRLADFGVM